MKLSFCAGLAVPRGYPFYGGEVEGESGGVSCQGLPSDQTHTAAQDQGLCAVHARHEGQRLVTSVCGRGGRGDYLRQWGWV